MERAPELAPWKQSQQAPSTIHLEVCGRAVDNAVHWRSWPLRMWRESQSAQPIAQNEPLIWHELAVKWRAQSEVQSEVQLWAA